MPAPPRKPVDEMTEDEFREWKQRLFTQGRNPVAIRQEGSASVSSYAWDPDLGATVEHADGNRYIVGIKDGKLARLEQVESLIGSEGVGSRPAMPTKATAPQTANPNPPGVRKRRLA